MLILTIAGSRFVAEESLRRRGIFARFLHTKSTACASKFEAGDDYQETVARWWNQKRYIEPGELVSYVELGDDAGRGFWR